MVDAQRQCGNAALFRTRAPYERSFPYHEWVLHEQRLAGCPRLHLAGAETFHQAHVLLELDKAYISGARKDRERASRHWSNHLLAPLRPADARGQELPETVLSRVTRLEFQDGKRKKAKNFYHGRGTVHSHSLDFLQNIEAIGLENKISAHLPGKDDQPLLHGLVPDGQRDRTSSGVPLREGPSAWDSETGKVLLQHTEEDQEQHIRPYFPVTMEVTKCHEDVQQPDGNGAVLRYVATYSMKFSDSMNADWLNDQASDYSVARRILFSYHPLEPEMWLTLAQEKFPQIDHKGTLVDIFVPLPDVANKPMWLLNYEASRWRSADMPLIAYLRKSNKDGAIIRYIVEGHERQVLQTWQVAMETGGLSAKAAVAASKDLLQKYKRLLREAGGSAEEGPGTLAEFAAASDCPVAVEELAVYANNYKSKGEKLIAASPNSMLNDRYYGQWVVLHVPFLQVADLEEKAADVLCKVPAHYKYFALALTLAPWMWSDDQAIRAQMELEAYNKAMVETILHKVRAQRSAVAKYVSGELMLGEDEMSEEEMEEGEARQRNKPELTASQKKLRDAMKDAMEVALKAAEAQDEDQLEQLMADAQDSKMLFASGPPGTGKTFVVHDRIRHWQARGARVLFVLPTGQLASEMRQAHPQIDVDTYHGGLWFHKDLSEAMGILTQYDLIVLDEVSMLTDVQFERVVAMWNAADRLPCIVLLGDFWQLPVADRKARRCEESELWRPNVKVINFREQVRCKDPYFQKILDGLRTAQPSMEQLKRKILLRHRAWTNKKPEAWDVLNLLRHHPDTTIVTCTRRACALVNQLAVQVLFRDRHKKPLGVVDMDYEANEKNYTKKGDWVAGRLRPAETEVFEGQRVFLTRNLDKENGFVNGMAAVVEGYDVRSRCLHMLTKLGKSLVVHLYTEEVPGHGNVTSFPVRLGYSSTIPKIQGATLPHVTIWLDRPFCRAAAYVAMSRVEHSDNYLIAGKVSPAHFVPAH